MRPAVLVFVSVSLALVRSASAQTREPARFGDLFPAATAGAAVGAVAGFQLGKRIQRGDNEKVAVVASMAGAVIGSATGVWLVERNDRTDISYFDAMGAAATGVLPSILIAAAVTSQLPKAWQPWLGTVTFSVMQGASTAALAARHSRHAIDDAQ